MIDTMANPRLSFTDPCARYPGRYFVNNEPRGERGRQTRGAGRARRSTGWWVGGLFNDARPANMASLGRVALASILASCFRGRPAVAQVIDGVVDLGE